MLEWNHEDPSSFLGNEEERLSVARKIRDEIKLNIQSFVDKHILVELNAQSEQLKWESTIDPVGYQLSTRNQLLNVTASRSDFGQDQVLSQAAWIESLVNLLMMEFGTSMLSLLEQTSFSKDQLIGWMYSIVKQAGLHATQSMSVHQFESILHSQYEKNQTHVRIMTYSLSNMLNQQILVDVLMKAIQDKRTIIWLGKEDAGVLVGAEGDELGPQRLQVLRNGIIEAKSISEWLTLSSENDALMIVERK